MSRTRIELRFEMDPTSIKDRAELPALVAHLAAQLAPPQWAGLELLSLEVCRHSAIDRETRRQLLQLPHRTADPKTPQG